MITRAANANEMEERRLAEKEERLARRLKIAQVKCFQKADFSERTLIRRKRSGRRGSANERLFPLHRPQPLWTRFRLSYQLCLTCCLLRIKKTCISSRHLPFFLPTTNAQYFPPYSDRGDASASGVGSSAPDSSSRQAGGARRDHSQSSEGGEKQS